MTSLRPRIRCAAAVVLAATGVLTAPAAVATAAGVKHSSHTANNSDQLPVQQNNGYDAACGPAADVAAMSFALGLIGLGNVALYTGPGRTGSGCDVITGNRLAIGTDFQVMGMKAANVDNQSDEPVAVYSDQTDDLDAVVPAGADSDIAPVDVNFAAYPEGTTPPPDDRGLNPTAVFHFTPAA